MSAEFRITGPDPDQKILTFQIPLGSVKLMFTKADGVWQCHIADEFMIDLQKALNGIVPTEHVQWVDIPNLGNDNDR